MQPGDFVSHPAVGTGRVISVSGNNADVRFEGQAETRIFPLSTLELLKSVPANKLWRIRDHGATLAANIERTTPINPEIIETFKSLLAELTSIVPEGHWEVIPHDTASATLYIRVKTQKGSTRGAFLGLEEKARRPLYLVIAIIEIERLPKAYESLFKLIPKGYHGKDYLRAEVMPDKLSEVPQLLAALQALIQYQ